MDHTFTIIRGWQTVAQYARACGVGTRAITDRMKRGHVTHIHVHGVDIIDSNISVPRKAMLGKTEKAPRFVWPDTMPPKEELVWVWRFANEQSVRADRIYRALLYNRIQGWGVCERTLVRKSDALAILGK